MSLQGGTAVLLAAEALSFRDRGGMVCAPESVGAAVERRAVSTIVSGEGIMNRRAFLLAIGLPPALLAGAGDEWGNWPDGTSPLEIGKRVAERFVPSP